MKIKAKHFLKVIFSPYKIIDKNIGINKLKENILYTTETLAKI